MPLGVLHGLKQDPWEYLFSKVTFCDWYFATRRHWPDLNGVQIGRIRIELIKADKGIMQTANSDARLMAYQLRCGQNVGEWDWVCSAALPYRTRTILASSTPAR